MYVPRKPHPAGNEYHTIACCGWQVCFALELMKGKDTPPQAPPLEFSAVWGKTASLLLRLTKSVHKTGRYVILDSGFCVLLAIVALKIHGLFSAAMIKKRRFWPTFIEGAIIQAHMATKEIGESWGWEGQYHSLGHKIDVNCIATQDVDYTMLMMGTAGTTQAAADGKKRYRTGRSGPFHYNEQLENHMKGRGTIDEINHARHHPISLSATMAPRDWSDRQFWGVIMEFSEANARSINHQLNEDKGKPKMSQQRFRRVLAEALINNPLWLEEQQLACQEEFDEVCETPHRPSKRPRAGGGGPLTCGWCEMPNHAGRYTGTGPLDGFEQKGNKYPQRKCSKCRTLSKYYCRCNPVIAYCKEHLFLHALNQ